MTGSACSAPKVLSRVSSGPCAEAHLLPRGSLLSVHPSVKQLPEACGGPGGLRRTEEDHGGLGRRGELWWSAQRSTEVRGGCEGGLRRRPVPREAARPEAAS